MGVSWTKTKSSVRRDTAAVLMVSRNTPQSRRFLRCPPRLFLRQQSCRYSYHWLPLRFRYRHYSLERPGQCFPSLQSRKASRLHFHGQRIRYFLRKMRFQRSRLQTGLESRSRRMFRLRPPGLTLSSGWLLLQRRRLSYPAQRPMHQTRCYRPLRQFPLIPLFPRLRW